MDISKKRTSTAEAIELIEALLKICISLTGLRKYVPALNTAIDSLEGKAVQGDLFNQDG